MGDPRTGEAVPGAVTARIAAYVATLRYEDLSALDVTKTKQHVLDTLGAMIMGTQTDAGRLIVDFARAQAARGDASVIGAEFKCSCTDAALANGTLCHADEVDDVHHSSVVHGGCAAVPPALALGERERVSGEAFIKAVVVGYDIACRVSLALDPSLLVRNKHSPIGAPNCFGAAAAASSVLALDEKSIESALGLAAQQASGTTAYFHEPRHMAKAFASGVSARNGVTAALLAGLGFQGPPAIFDAPCAILDMYPGKHHIEELTKDLEGFHYVVDTPIKKYPVGAPIQAPLDALFGLMADEHIASPDIEEVVVRMAEVYASVVSNRPIQDVNLQYLMAVGACCGRLGLAEAHSASASGNPEVQDFRRRIRLVGDSRFATMGPASVEVLTKGGTRHARTVERVDLTQAQVEAKFLELAAPVLGLQNARAIVEAVGRLEEIADVSELAALLRK
jgi:2-methylcitrate dehydratase PrpD